MGTDPLLWNKTQGRPAQKAQLAGHAVALPGERKQSVTDTPRPPPRARAPKRQTPVLQCSFSALGDCRGELLAFLPMTAGRAEARNRRAVRPAGDAPAEPVAGREVRSEDTTKRRTKP